MTYQLSRRRMAFWIGFGLVSLGERMKINAMDELASTVMHICEDESVRDSDAGDPTPDAVPVEPDVTLPDLPQRWTSLQNENWRWYQREHQLDDDWTVTGITAPVDRHNQQRISDVTGYLAESLIPLACLRDDDLKRLGKQPGPKQAADSDSSKSGGSSRSVETQTIESHERPRPIQLPFGDREQADAGCPSDERRHRDGRPPSKWLRSLTAVEIRIWLSTVDPPEAGVRGMTHWTHLTRDHSFDPKKIAGLTEAEQALLHGAAHAGY